MLIECSLALYSAAKSHSVALLAYGSDSLNQLLAAVTVLLQFVPAIGLGQASATRFAALLLMLLMGVIAATSIGALSSGTQVETSLPGMFVTAGAVLMMPALAFLKRPKARELNNAALSADAI